MLIYLIRDNYYLSEIICAIMGTVINYKLHGGNTWET